MQGTPFIGMIQEIGMIHFLMQLVLWPISAAILTLTTQKSDWGDPTTGYQVDVYDYTGKTLTFESSVSGEQTTLTVPEDLTQGNSWEYECDINVPLYLGGSSPLLVTTDGQLQLDEVLLGNNTMTIVGDSNVRIRDSLSGSTQSHLICNVDASLFASSTNFYGSIVFNGSTISLTESGGLTAASDIKINAGVAFTLGNSITLAVKPGQRISTNSLTLNGGEFDHAGQALKDAALDEVVGDTVESVSVERGDSKLELRTVSTSSGTYLHATTLSRETGSILRVIAKKLGQNTNTTDRGQQFLVDSSPALIGAGGAEGSTTMSVYPWIFCHNSLDTLEPNSIGTLSTNGIRGLQDAEYDTTLTGTATRNVSIEHEGSISLGANQTVNSLVCNWYNAKNMGAGYTITVTSGALLLRKDSSRLGEISHADAGTIDFGAAEACIFTSEGNDTTSTAIGAVIAGTAGLTKGGPSRLTLSAPNTYSGTTTITRGILRVGDGTLDTATAKLGDGNVVIHDGGQLSISQYVTDCIDDAMTVTLRKDGNSNGIMQLGSGIDETVLRLLIAGEEMDIGTYGSTSSSATFTNDTYFTGTGILRVVAEPPKGTLVTIQ